MTLGGIAWRGTTTVGVRAGCWRRGVSAFRLNEMTVALSRDYHRCIVLVLFVLLLLVFSFSGAICSRFLERTNWEATDVHETELQGRW